MKRPGILLREIDFNHQEDSVMCQTHWAFKGRHTCTGPHMKPSQEHLDRFIPEKVIQSKPPKGTKLHELCIDRLMKQVEKLKNPNK